MNNDLFGERTMPAPAPVKPSVQQLYRREQLTRLPAKPDWAIPSIPTLNGEPEIILNCETTGVKWWAGDRPIGWAYILPFSGRSGYLPIRHQGGGNLPVAQVHAFLSDIRNTHIVNTNTKFDLHMAREDGVDLCDGRNNTFGDAAHYAALLDDNRRRFTLDGMSKELLGWDVTQDGLGPIPDCITTEGEFQFLHASLVAPYALRNCEQVRRLIEQFEPDIADQDLGRTLALEQAIIPVVVEMEKNGMPLDMDLLNRWRSEAQQALRDKLDFIFHNAGIKVDSPDSSKDLVNLFKARGIPITSFTELGAPSFTAHVMRSVGAHDPCVRAMYEAGQLADLDSKYLTKYWRAMRQSDGWLRYNLHQLKSVKSDEDASGTVSGRFSAAGDRGQPFDGLGTGGFNPQQAVAVEKQLERGFCPDYVVRKLFKMNFAADMMQVEYRLFAHYADIAQPFHLPAKGKMIAGKWTWIQGPLADFHALVAELLNNPRLNRKLVKNINFAKIYGAGLIKFAFMLGYITEAQFKELSARRDARDWSVFDDPLLAEASSINAAYDHMFPAVTPLLKLARETAQTRGYVMDLIGRRARPWGRKLNSAFNRVIQGGAASINKLILVEVYKLRKMLGLTMRVTMHDELAGNLVDPRWGVSAMKRVLNHQYFDLKAPILWDCASGPTWADCKAGNAGKDFAESSKALGLDETKYGGNTRQ